MCKHQEKVRSNQASISINSCTELSKTQLFPVIIIKEFFFLFYFMFWSRDFQARWENYVMKNEKWIVFPESRYVNSNPANLSKNYLVTITHSPLKTSPHEQCNFIAEDMKYFNILQIMNYNTNSFFLRSSSLMLWSGSLIKILSVSDHNFFILKFHCFMSFLNFITSNIASSDGLNIWYQYF